MKRMHEVEKELGDWMREQRASVTDQRLKGVLDSFLAAQIRCPPHTPDPCRHCKGLGRVWAEAPNIPWIKSQWIVCDPCHGTGEQE